MHSLTISYLEEAHLEGLVQVEKLSFPQPWSRESFVYEMETNQLATYLVASCQGQVVGYGGMWLVLDEAHITNIAVHPLYRRKGIGKSLVQALILEAIKRKIRSMTLEVRASNQAAQALYTDHGFKVKGRRPGYYQDNQEDALIMWRYFHEPNDES